MIQGHDFGMPLPVIILTTMIFWVVVGVAAWAVKMLIKQEQSKSRNE